MLKYLFFSLLFLTNSEASVLTLEDILSYAKEPTRIAEMIQEEENGLEAKNLANSADNPFIVHNGVTRANSRAISGYQYDVTLSKEFKLGNVQALEQQQTRLNNDYCIDALIVSASGIEWIENITI